MTEVELKSLKSGDFLYYHGDLYPSFTKGNSYPIQGFSSNKDKILINNTWISNKYLIDNFGLVPEGQKIIPIPKGYKVKNYNDEEILLELGKLNYEQILGTGIGKGNVNYLTVPCSINRYDKLSAISKLLVVADYLNNGWIPNWNDSKEKKFTIIVDRSFSPSGELSIESSYTFIPGVVYFKTYEVALDAIKVLGEEAIKKVLQ